MDAKAKTNRLKLFVTESGKEVFSSTGKREDPIVGLTNNGKGMLHGKTLADCITAAQESMILLHVARSFYFRFRGDDKPSVVTPQALAPRTGGSASYKQMDVDYFRKVFKIVKDKREEEKNVEDHTLRFCYFDFPKEHTEWLEASKKAKAEEEAAEAEAAAAAEKPAESEDDNSLGEEVDFD